MSDEAKNEIRFVLITQGWLDEWLPVLKETELKAYLRLAYHYNRQKKVSFPGQQTIAQAIGLKSYRPVMSALTKLEELDLIEALKKPPQRGMKGWPSNQYRMLHVDEDGYHRAGRQQSSLKEAIEEDRAFWEFYIDLTLKYNNHVEMLNAAFENCPAFRDYCFSSGLCSENWQQHEEFCVPIAFSLFSLVTFNEKYSDLYPFESHFDDHMREGNLKRIEITKAVKKEVLTNWERVKNDDAYCRNYIADHYPEYYEALKTIAMKMGRSSKEYIAKARELVENHADSREISQYYDYGIFKELAQKHGVCSRAVKEVYEEAVVEDVGEIRFESDSEDYVHRVVLPYESAFLTEEEKRFAYLEAEEITDDERRDLKGTLEKVKAARLKALDTLVEKTIYTLACAYRKGQVRKNGGGEYIPEIRYYSETEDGGYILESYGGHLPAKMDLGDLLRHITYEINRHTHYLREYDDIYEPELASHRATKQLEIIGKPNKSALVPIPPVTLDQIRARFEQKNRDRGQYGGG